MCLCITFIQLHTPPHNTFSNIWLEIKLQNTDLILTTSVQAHLLQHKSLCPLNLALRFQKSCISLQLRHNFTTSPQNNNLIYKDLFSHLWYLFWNSWEVCQHAGCAKVSFCAGKKGLQVKFDYGHTSSGNFQTGWDWLNYEFRTGWQRCFLRVMHYTSFKAHSYVLLSCSQTSLKNSRNGKWHSKPGRMASFKGPLKTLLRVTDSQQDKIAETFFLKLFVSPLHYQEPLFLGYLPSLVQESLG